MFSVYLLREKEKSEVIKPNVDEFIQGTITTIIRLLLNQFRHSADAVKGMFCYQILVKDIYKGLLYSLLGVDIRACVRRRIHAKWFQVWRWSVSILFFPLAFYVCIYVEILFRVDSQLCKVNSFSSWREQHVESSLNMLR